MSSSFIFSWPTLRLLDLYERRELIIIDFAILKKLQNCGCSPLQAAIRSSCGGPYEVEAVRPNLKCMAYKEHRFRPCASPILPIPSGAKDDKVTSIQVLGCYPFPHSFDAEKNSPADTSCSLLVSDTIDIYDFLRCDGRYRACRRSLCCFFPEVAAW